ncbi:hypothetical protein DPEC_G00166040 [Dallia pectoralis]|uniref:Uncharacterized protein n=1 Tax=Dallia pectoralis TaxID=75939 RepID=A0ACC2GHV7_DALPE|nr:hypothetical protein DPEC_G00166040 [Dallia pectoralis]
MCFGVLSATIDFLYRTSQGSTRTRGHHWPSLHNPLIDWTQTRIHLKAAVPPVPGSTLTGVSEYLDLSSVPDVYHDLQEVFSKTRANAINTSSSL